MTLPSQEQTLISACSDRRRISLCFILSPLLQGEGQKQRSLYGSELYPIQVITLCDSLPRRGPKGTKKKTCQSYRTQIEIKGPWMWARVCAHACASVTQEGKPHLKKDSGGKECLQRFGLQRKKSKQVEIRNYNTTQNEFSKHLLNTYNA